MSVVRSPFFWKIYSAFALLFLGNTLLVSWLVFYKVRGTINDIVMENLKAKAEFLAPNAREVFLGENSKGEAMIKQVGAATSTRITLIQEGGQVLEDSEADPKAMENHWNRPEVQQALVDSFGISERLSSTLKDPLVYLAKAIKGADGKVLGVVRVSLHTYKIKHDLQAVQWTIGLVALGGMLLALGIGWTLARRVTVPIREMVQVAEALRIGRYEQKVRTLTHDELGRLGDTLNRLGAELTHKISELHRLENVRRDFVANVSHEIKTPLTSIKGYVETLLAGAINDSDNRVRFLEKIDRNAARLSSLVQDLLSLARIEAGEESLKPVPVEWNPLVNSVLSRYEDAIQQKHLRIRVNAPTQPLVVLGDKEAIIQVLDNLLTNAIKYTPEGGRITVSLSMKAAWGRLDVEDTGIGIPAEHLDRIFERFYRVDKARSRDLGGTGLGLSIVKHLVSAMGGEVGVESIVGVGSKFSIKLKLAV